MAGCVPRRMGSRLMTDTNFGTGFTGFKSAIEMVTEALGGQHARPCVAHIFSESLTTVIQNRKAERYPSYSGLIWTEATDLDFDCARRRALTILERLRDPATAVAQWKGIELQVRDDIVVAAAGGYSIIIAMLGSHDEYCSRARGQITKWRVFMTDDGKRLVNARDSTLLMGGKPAATTAKTAEGGAKSLRKIVETFFGVKFVELVNA
jgi:hypothetical protein